MQAEQMKFTPFVNKFQDDFMSISSSLFNDAVLNKLALIQKEKQTPTFKGGTEEQVKKKQLQLDLQRGLEKLIARNALEDD